MKNSTKAVAAALAAAMSLSCITIYAAGKPTIAKSPFSFSESNNSLRFKAENLSDKNAEASQNLRGTKPEGKGGRMAMPELTEEKKAELAEKLKADLAEKLADEKITQEEYDEAIEKIESGDFRPSGKGMGYKKPMCRPERKDTSTDSDLTLA